jgi:hypothetical protein
MAATGIPPGDVVIALAFVAATVVAGVVAATMAVAAMSVFLGDKGKVLAFAETVAVVVAAVFVGGEVGVRTIVGVACRKMGLTKLCKY